MEQKILKMTLKLKRKGRTSKNFKKIKEAGIFFKKRRDKKKIQKLKLAGKIQKKIVQKLQNKFRDNV